MNPLQLLDYAVIDFRMDQQGLDYLVDVKADATIHFLRSLAQIAQSQHLTYAHFIKLILTTTCHRWSLELNTP